MNEGKLPEINIKMTEVFVESKKRPLRVFFDVKESIKEKLMPINPIVNFPTPTLGERIARMESMYQENLPLALKQGMLSNIISLRRRKILKDHCE